MQTSKRTARQGSCGFSGSTGTHRTKQSYTNRQKKPKSPWPYLHVCPRLEKQQINTAQKGQTADRARNSSVEVLLTKSSPCITLLSYFRYTD